MGTEKLDISKLIYYGFYPRIYQEKIEPRHYYPSYIETYLERDIRSLQGIRNLPEFQKFLQLCAGRVGQIVNFNNLSSDIGVSAVTIKNWLNLLQASYIVFLLYPYHANINKRLIKSPKLYFYDVGLAANLIGIEDTKQVITHPLKGNLFENLVVIEILKHRYNQGLKENISFYHDSSGKEVDIIYANGSSLIPIEIKTAETIHNEFFIGVNYFASLNLKRTKHKTIIYAGDDSYKQKDTRIENLESLTGFLGELQV